MRLGLTMMALCSLLTACATNALDAGGAPVKPMQRDDESERLPIGRVLTIERLVAADTADVIASAARKPTPRYRYTVRLLTGESRTAELEALFAIGECVAFRPQSSGRGDLMVSALPGECRPGDPR